MNRSQVKVDTDLSLGHGLPHYVLCTDLSGVAGSSVGKRPHHRPAIRSRGEAQSVHLKAGLPGRGAQAHWAEFRRAGAERPGGRRPPAEQRPGPADLQTSEAQAAAAGAEVRARLQRLQRLGRPRLRRGWAGSRPGGAGGARPDRLDSKPGRLAAPGRRSARWARTRGRRPSRSQSMRGAARAVGGRTGQLWPRPPAPGPGPPPLLLLLAVLLGGAGAQYSSDLCSWKGRTKEPAASRSPGPADAQGEARLQRSGVSRVQQPARPAPDRAAPHLVPREPQPGPRDPSLGAGGGRPSGPSRALPSARSCAPRAGRSRACAQDRAGRDGRVRRREPRLRWSERGPWR
ncbi:hypothetical protein J1605_003782 [Eschrichtius robustus]|uniref:Uncharacterized protein n=1 Tax=Eschrichtius robustus TaxID=9764 RepID=A0AB34HPS3_ESCRO|nr:hypothetical protein J1605_003782 [Eschrichtius robustus]